MIHPARRREHGRSLAGSRTKPELFTDFYELVSPGVLRFFARETRNPQLAFDLTAETFAKAFEKRAAFRGENDEQAAAWLWSIARTELARWYRSRKIELGAVRRLGLERPAPSDEELREVERLTSLDEAREEMQQALARLPGDQREVLQLHFVEELSYAEIAQRLGVTNDVARARTSRALRALRSLEDVHRVVQALEA